MERNWAGTHEYTAPRIEASTVEEVHRIVRAGGRVHALGTRHSFTDLPDTDRHAHRTASSRLPSSETRRRAPSRSPRGRATASSRVARRARLGAAQPRIAPAHLGRRCDGDRHARLGRRQWRAHDSGARHPICGRGRRGARGAPRRRRLRRTRRRCRRVRDPRGADPRHPARLPYAAGHLHGSVVGCRARRSPGPHGRRVQRLDLHALGGRHDRAGLGQDAPRGPTRMPSPTRSWTASACADPNRPSAAATTSPRSAACRGPGCSGCRTSGSTRSRRSARRSRPSTSWRAQHAAAALERRAGAGRRHPSPSGRERDAHRGPRRAVAERRLPAGRRDHPLHLVRPPRRGGGAAAGHRGRAATRSASARTGARCTASTRWTSRACTRASPTPERCSNASTPKAGSSTRTSSGSGCARRGESSGLADAAPPRPPGPRPAPAPPAKPPTSREATDLGRTNSVVSRAEGGFGGVRSMSAPRREMEMREASAEGRG